MAEPLTEDSEFVVTDSTVVDLIIAAFCYCMVYTVYKYNSGNSKFDKLVLLGLVPAIIFTIRAFVKKPAITINKKGIYLLNSTGIEWSNFYTAKIKQLDLAVGGYSDRFVLEIEYYKENRDLYKLTFSLLNTYNKSEEEIIEAIKFFYDLYKKGLPVSKC